MVARCAQEHGLLLAVWLLLLHAHAHCLVTSSFTRLNNMRDAAKALGNLEDARQLATASVVQDWSLVCKELCGAGLGLEPCAAHCAAPNNEITILSSQFGLAKCENLCRLQPDNPDCKCHGAAISQILGNQVCSSFCLQRATTLNGCSSCELSRIIIASARQSKSTHGSSSKKDAVSLSSMNIKPASDAITDADTPDWNELCKELCKTGDGGSLCNCDLAPFLN